MGITKVLIDRTSIEIAACRWVQCREKSESPASSAPAHIRVLTKLINGTQSGLPRSRLRERHRVDEEFGVQHIFLVFSFCVFEYSRFHFCNAQIQRNGHSVTFIVRGEKTHCDHHSEVVTVLAVQI